MKRITGTLDAIGRRGRGRLTFSQTRTGSLRRHIQQNRQIGNKSLGCKVVQLTQQGNVDATSISLVGKCRISKTIADHPLAPRERRTNHIRNHLRTRGEEQQNLAPRHRGIFHFLSDKSAYEFRESGSSRFTCHEYGLAFCP